MKLRALISSVAAFLALGSCMQVAIVPEDLSAPEFLNVNYTIVEQLGGDKIILEAQLSKSNGISSAGFTVGRRVTQMYEYPCKVEGNSLRVELHNLPDNTNYLFYAWARNANSELRTRLYDFFVGLKPDPEPTPEPTPEPEPDPEPEPEPAPGPDPEPEPSPEPTPDPDPEPAPVLPPSGGVVISDENFLAYLLSLCDSNGDKTISSAEAQSVTAMDFCSDRIVYLDGIRHFPNLKRLSARGSVWKGSLTCEDLSKNTLLTYLDCSYNKIEDISLPVSLETLICRFNKLESLKLQSSGKLKTLDCYGNYLDTIDLSKCSALEELTCGLNNFTTLDLSKNLRLDYLDLTDCSRLKTVFLSRSHKIKHIIADNSVDFKYID